MMVCLIGSKSSAGLIGAAVGGLLIMILIVWKYLIDRQASAKIAMISIVIGVSIILIFSESLISYELISLENSDRTALNSSYKDIWIKDNKLGVEFDERELVVSVKKMECYLS